MLLRAADESPNDWIIYSSDNVGIVNEFYEHVLQLTHAYRDSQAAMRAAARVARQPQRERPPRSASAQ